MVKLVFWLFKIWPISSEAGEFCCEVSGLGSIGGVAVPAEVVD